MAKLCMLHAYICSFWKSRRNLRCGSLPIAMVTEYLCVCLVVGLFIVSEGCMVVLYDLVQLLVNKY